MQVFISHAAADRDFLEREIVSFLNNNGVSTWYSKAAIKTGEHWERSILKGLQSSDWFIVLLSPRSADSEWVRDELNWAVDERPGRIIPILMEHCDLRRFHIRLPRIQYLDFVNQPDDSKRQLLSRLTSQAPELENLTLGQFDLATSGGSTDSQIAQLISILDLRAASVLSTLDQRKRQALTSLRANRWVFIDYFQEEAIKLYRRKTEQGIRLDDDIELQNWDSEAKADQELLARTRKLIDELESIRELFISLHSENKQALLNRMFSLSHDIVVQIHFLLWIRGKKELGLVDVPGARYRMGDSTPSEFQVQYPGIPDENVTQFLPAEAAILWETDSRELRPWGEEGGGSVLDFIEGQLAKLKCR